jgi:hypothetical protein
MMVLQQIKHNDGCNLLVSYYKFCDNNTFMFVIKKKKKKTRFEISICVIMLWDIM